MNLTRREFLALCSSSAIAALLAACGVPSTPAPTATLVPTAAPSATASATPTAIPSATPTVPPTVTATPTATATAIATPNPLAVRAAALTRIPGFAWQAKNENIILVDAKGATVATLDQTAGGLKFTDGTVASNLLFKANGSGGFVANPDGQAVVLALLQANPDIRFLSYASTDGSTPVAVRLSADNKIQLIQDTKESGTKGYKYDADAKALAAVYDDGVTLGWYDGKSFQKTRVNEKGETVFADGYNYFMIMPDVTSGDPEIDKIFRGVQKDQRFINIRDDIVASMVVPPPTDISDANWGKYIDTSIKFYEGVDVQTVKNYLRKMNDQFIRAAMITSVHNIRPVNGQGMAARDTIFYGSLDSIESNIAHEPLHALQYSKYSTMKFGAIRFEIQPYMFEVVQAKLKGNMPRYNQMIQLMQNWDFGF